MISPNGSCTTSAVGSFTIAGVSGLCCDKVGNLSSDNNQSSLARFSNFWKLRWSGSGFG